MFSVEALMDAICLIGTIAFAVSGAMAGIKKHMDLFGVVVLAVITATGGGIIRDLLLGILPPAAFIDCTYVTISIITSLVVYFIAHSFSDIYCQNTGKLDAINNIFDALGLGIFVVFGCRTAIDHGFMQNAFLVIFIGMITGIGGGILRDIMVQEIPFILRKRIYALAALAGSMVFYFIYPHLNYVVSVFISAGITFLLRLLATHFKWNIPPAY